MAGDAQSENSATAALVSAPRRELLDVIDKLRGQGLAEQLNLPQLVVCGDQSAGIRVGKKSLGSLLISPLGKSSVLEALTKINFPRHRGVCTRFATEIALRRDKHESVTVKIEPDGQRPKPEQDKLRAFSGHITNLKVLAADLKDLIRDAQEAMGINMDTATNSGFEITRDVLRIEVFGPDREDLTIVDLPGIIHNSSDNGADKITVEHIMQSYISKDYTLCLPVIDASYDRAVQGVLDLVRRADKEGQRTLGIITKPDKLIDPSDQKECLELARNELSGLKFTHGWHVLRNRSDKDQNVSFDKRSEDEAKFFRDSEFKILDPACVGIEALITRLSDLLYRLSRTCARKLPSDITDRIYQTERELGTLGRELADAKDCQVHLSEIVHEASKLCRDSYIGSFQSSLFIKAGDIECGLRAALDQSYGKFAQDMATRGLTYRTPTEDPPTEDLDGSEPSRPGPTSVTQCVNPLDIHEDTSVDEEELDSGPYLLSFAAAMTWASQISVLSKDTGLPDHHSSQVVGHLFRVGLPTASSRTATGTDKDARFNRGSGAL